MDLDHVRVCDCSICVKRGALIHRVAKKNLQLETPVEDLVVYQWGTMTAKDYFCANCGILPFRKPSAPTQDELDRGVEPFDGWAVNVRCLEGVDLDAIVEVQIKGSELKI